MRPATLLFTLMAGLTALQMPALAQSKSPAQQPRMSPEVSQTAPTAVRNFVFIAQQASGWRQFAPRQAPIFKVGEPLQFYAEPVNLGWSTSGRAYRFEIRVDVEIRTREGQILWGQKDFGHLSQNSTTVDPQTYITGSVAVQGLQPGLYMLSVRFRDPHNSRIVETEMAFGIIAARRLMDA